MSKWLSRLLEEVGKNDTLKNTPMSVLSGVFQENISKILSDASPSKILSQDFKPMSVKSVSNPRNSLKKYNTKKEKQYLRRPTDKPDIGLNTLIGSENDCIISDYEDFSIEKSVALLNQKLNLPKLWAEAFVKVQIRPKPDKIMQLAWDNILHQVNLLLDVRRHHLHNILTHDWSLQDIFGCHKTSPMTRHDSKGLLVLLHPKEIVEVTSSFIKLAYKDQVTNSFYRNKPVYPLEITTLYEL